MILSTGQTYSECLKNCRSFNERIANERRHRLPFLDTQTGIAQSPSNLWRNKNDRRLSNDPSTAFSYPTTQKWRKRKSNFNIYTTDVRWSNKTEPTDASESYGNEMDANTSNMAMSTSFSKTMSNAGSDSQLNVSLRNMGDMAGGNSEAKLSQDQSWYDDSDPQLEDFEDLSDGDDYEETYVKKKSKKKKTTSATGEKKTVRRPADIPDSEKPYICKHCNARYKTKPGLHYHLTHAHVNEYNEEKAQAAAAAAAAASAGVSAIATGSHSPRSVNTAIQRTTNSPFGRPVEISVPPPQSEGNTTSIRPLGKFQGEPNQYCDFCLGDARENKKTGQSEELINCSDCGRAGHPSCLNFTANMVISTKKYGWQCIECKSCAMCGTSENDDQLLFCDDCDRGFHMYCLRPPLSAPPEGNWSCHLCVVEFGPNASRPAEIGSSNLGH